MINILRERKRGTNTTFLTLVATALLPSAGCGGGVRHKSPSNPPIGPPQSGVLHLTPGRSTSQFTIVAPRPSKYPWNARITAPAAADVAIAIHTWYGVNLGVLDSTHDAAWCTTSGTRSTCLSRLPILEAQLAGRWAVVATKRTGPAATVHVAITFYKP